MGKLKGDITASRKIKANNSSSYTESLPTQNNINDVIANCQITVKNDAKKQWSIQRVQLLNSIEFNDNFMEQITPKFLDLFC